jgi:hypothetical protein
MSNGIAVNRELLIILENGTSILEWDAGVGIDLLSSEFIEYQEKCYTRPIGDHELEILKRAGRVISFDERLVIFTSLPEVPREPTP